MTMAEASSNQEALLQQEIRKGSECPVCWQLYNGIRQPKLLPCSHRACRDCLMKIAAAEQEEQHPLCIKCPVCRDIILPVETPGQVDKLPTDYYVLSVAENTRRLTEQRAKEAEAKQRHPPPSAPAASANTTTGGRASGSAGTIGIKNKVRKPREESSEESDNSESDNSDDGRRQKKTAKFDQAKMLKELTEGMAGKRKQGGKKEKKKETPNVFSRDLFCCSRADALVMPHTTEHHALKLQGLGYKFGVQFDGNGSENKIRRSILKAYPRLEQLEAFAICKPARANDSLDVLFTDIPNGLELQKLKVDTLVIVPLRDNLEDVPRDGDTPSTSSLECPKCGIPVLTRQWIDHNKTDCVEGRDSTGPARPASRRTY